MLNVYSCQSTVCVLVEAHSARSSALAILLHAAKHCPRETDIQRRSTTSHAEISNVACHYSELQKIQPLKTPHQQHLLPYLASIAFELCLSKLRQTGSLVFRANV